MSESPKPKQISIASFNVLGGSLIFSEIGDFSFSIGDASKNSFSTALVGFSNDDFGVGFGLMCFEDALSEGLLVTS